LFFGRLLSLSTLASAALTLAGPLLWVRLVPEQASLSWVVLAVGAFLWIFTTLLFREDDD
ncbi:MAG: hypothetical protein AAGK78_15650, partial [Planctomycetota bacterium]